MSDESVSQHKERQESCRGETDATNGGVHMSTPGKFKCPSCERPLRRPNQPHNCLRRRRSDIGEKKKKAAEE